MVTNLEPWMLCTVSRTSGNARAGVLGHIAADAAGELERVGA